MTHLETADKIITAKFFEQMTKFAPFETKPVLAVAASGGADSMALTLLADDWARRQDGAVIALTVDHGLRRGSAAEAKQVHDWLSARGIPHHILTWQGPAPERNLQAQARALRYELLTRYCREHGILHLLTAHHREDQAETVLLRLSQGSGPDGLAGMGGCTERHGVRILRPLLTVSRQDLRKFLNNEGQAWIEDPSNDNDAFARTKIRRILPALAEAGLSSETLAEFALRAGEIRRVTEEAVAQWLAKQVTLHPEGYATVRAGAFCGEAPALEKKALAALLTCLSGRAYGPRGKELERCYHSIREKKAATLLNCQLSFSGRKKQMGALMVCKEEAAVSQGRLPIKTGQVVMWDGRFRCRLSGGGEKTFELGPLGKTGWEALSDVRREQRCTLPARIGYTLPALWHLDTAVCVPHLQHVSMSIADTRLHAVFSPRKALAGAGFSYTIGAVSK